MEANTTAAPQKNRGHRWLSVGLLVLVGAIVWIGQGDWLRPSQTDPRLIGMWSGRFPAIPFYRQTFELHADGTAIVFRDVQAGFSIRWWVDGSDLFLKMRDAPSSFELNRLMSGES